MPFWKTKSKEPTDTCERCKAIHARDAKFCPQCGELTKRTKLTMVVELMAAPKSPPQPKVDPVKVWEQRIRSEHVATIPSQSRGAVPEDRYYALIIDETIHELAQRTPQHAATLEQFRKLINIDYEDNVTAATSALAYTLKHVGEEQFEAAQRKTTQRLQNLFEPL